MEFYKKEKEIETNVYGKMMINREFTVGEIMDMPFTTMPIALHNFLNRRLDFVKEENENKKVYYGHATDGLGYLVAEDEIK